MTKGFLFFVAILILNSSASATTYQKSDFSQKVVLVDWNSPEGIQRLNRSQFKNDFYQLAHHYQPQANPLYCGVASSVMVLNALRASAGTIPSQKDLEIQVPKIWGGNRISYPLYSQQTFFSEATDKVKDRKITQLQNVTSEHEKSDAGLDPGFMLDQLAETLKTFQLEVSTYHVTTPTGVDDFRKQLKKILADSTHFTVVNYQSKSVGQAGGGHISPLAAFDQKSDSVLLLDVSAYLNPWIWIPVKDLFLAMHTLDGKVYRGYLVVSEK